MGLTWIDHDTIEKPIEEITLGTDEAVDFEFKVETLKSANEAAASMKKNYAKKVNYESADKKTKKQKQLQSSQKV